MTRYYTQCVMTSSVRNRHYSARNKEFTYADGNADTGYIFHDSEESLDVHHIQFPLFVLSRLYTDAERRAPAQPFWAVRVDAKTIAASFSLRSILRPQKLGEYKNSSLVISLVIYDNLEKVKPTGWIHPNVKDSSLQVPSISYDAIYDTCTALERFTGACPCPRLEEGTCFPNTLYKEYPWLTEYSQSYSYVESSEHNKERYRNLNGFTYISGQCTTTQDFSNTLRPWDDYDFTIVSKRIQVFKDRGLESSRRFAHRKIECSECIFSYKTHKGVVKDCGYVRGCESGSKEEEVEELLYRWLDLTPYVQPGNPDLTFTLQEIQYLMLLDTDKVRLSNALTPARKTEVCFGGFTLERGFTGNDSPLVVSFRVVANRGDKQRGHVYSTYATLRQAFPDLPRSEDLPDNVVIDRKDLLAYAILSTHHTSQRNKRAWGMTYPTYKLSYSSSTHRNGAVITAAGCRFERHMAELSRASSITSYYYNLFGYMHRYPDVQKLRKMDDISLLNGTCLT